MFLLSVSLFGSFPTLLCSLNFSAGFKRYGPLGGRKSRPNPIFGLLMCCLFGLHRAKLNMSKRDATSAWPLQEPCGSHRRTRSLPPRPEAFYDREARVVEFNSIVRSSVFIFGSKKTSLLCWFLNRFEMI